MEDEGDIVEDAAGTSPDMEGALDIDTSGQQTERHDYEEAIPSARVIEAPTKDVLQVISHTDGPEELVDDCTELDVEYEESRNKQDIIASRKPLTRQLQPSDQICHKSGDYSDYSSYMKYEQVDGRLHGGHIPKLVDILGWVRSNANLEETTRVTVIHENAIDGLYNAVKKKSFDPRKTFRVKHSTGERESHAYNSDTQRSKRTKPTQLHRPADHEFSQKTERFNKFAFITIEPKGGYFKIPNMGIEMIIPRDSVDCATTLKISIRDSFKNFPQPAYKWSLFSPRVKIEPDDVRYKKPVYLIINHNIQMALSDFDGSFNPLMLHRDKEDAEWTIITSRPIHSGDQDTEKIHGFAICREKQAVLTSSAVIVAMTSNCEQCVCEFLDENSVTRRVMRMTVHVYADYQQHGGQLRVRTHVVHGINNREQDVETKEIERYGGHFLDSQTTYVDRSNQPLNIDIRVTADGNAHPSQQNYIDYDSLRLELDHMRDTWPHKSFTVPLVTDGAAAPARSVRIETTAEQCELERVARIDETKDLASLIQKTPVPVTTALQFQVAVGNETEGAVGGVFGKSPVYESALAQKRDRLIVLLRDHMTEAEKDKVRRYMVIEKIRYSLTAGPSDIDHIMLNTFVDTGDIQEVIDKLSAIGSLSEEMHRILRALSRE